MADKIIKGYDIKQSVFNMAIIPKVKELLDKEKIPLIVKPSENVLTIEEMKKKASDFLQNYLSGIDFNVNYIPNQDFKLIAKEVNKYPFNQQDEVAYELIKQKTKIVSVFELPIILNFSKVKGCAVINGLTFDDTGKTIKTVSHIELSNKSLNNHSVYIHECVHALLTNTENVLTNYYDDEILSMFFEYISLLDSDVVAFKNAEIMLLNEIKSLISKLNGINNLNFVNRNKIKLYLNSLLIVECLLQKYLSMPVLARKKLLDDIKCIFLDNYTLEDFLKDYNITSNNIVSSIDEGIRRVNRN